MICELEICGPVRCFVGPSVGLVNMAAKHRFPGSRVCKIGRCRICGDYSEADKLEFGSDVAVRVDRCSRHYVEFRQIAGDSDSDKVNIPTDR